MVIRASRRTLRVIAATAAVLMLVVLLPSSAQAAGGGDGCNSNRPNNFLTYYFSGEDGSVPGTYGGIRAAIDQYSPWVYPVSGATDFTSQWVMLTTSAATQWAQVGWWESAYGDRHTFVQFWDPGYIEWTDLTSPFPINTFVNYEVTYDPSCTDTYCFRFFVNGKEINRSHYDWAPNEQEDESEIHTEASQMPGAYGNPSYSTSIEKYYPAGAGSWSDVSGNTLTEEMSSSGQVTTAPSWDQVAPSAGTTGIDAYGSYDTACPEE